MPVDRPAAAAAIDAFLRAIGRDPYAEPDLVGTGTRVADAFIDELCAGYTKDTRGMLAANVLEGRGSGLVIVRDLPVATTCPHHLLPAIGAATVAFQPKERILGLGAVAALVEAHARRLTLQEHVGEAVVTELEEALEPSWVGCRLVLTHGCMVVRGERAVSARVETVALRGATSGKRLAAIHAALGVGR